MHLDVSAARGEEYLDASAGRCKSRALHLDARSSSMQGQLHLDADADATLLYFEYAPTVTSIVQRKKASSLVIKKQADLSPQLGCSAFLMMEDLER